MKTYTKTTQEPRLIIWNDGDSYSPRNDDTLGYFITVENRRLSPDNGNDCKWVFNIVRDTGDEATSVDEHMKLIKQGVEENLEHNEKVVKIFPVVRYEHSNVMYKLGTGKGFDASNCGFYIVTEGKQEGLGIKDSEIKAFVEDEIKYYNQWVNGEVWGYTLYDAKGQEIECCGSFYSLEDIGEHICSNYPSEAKDWENERLEDYITHN